MSELRKTKGTATFRGIIGNLDRTKDDIREDKQNRNYMDNEKIKMLKFSALKSIGSCVTKILLTS